MMINRCFYTRAAEPMAVRELLHYNDRSNVASEPDGGQELRAFHSMS